jgi:hypothetical protein
VFRNAVPNAAKTSLVTITGALDDIFPLLCGALRVEREMSLDDVLWR